VFSTGYDFNHERRKDDQMKRILALGLVAGVAILLAASLQPDLAAGDSKQAVLKIDGMTCGGCALSVRTVVKRIDGTHDVEVDWKKGRAVVSFDPDRVSAAEIAAAIEKKLSYRTEVVDDGGSSHE
jgi:copper chaperone